MKKVLFFLKLFILGASFSYALFKLRTDAAEFCYKCDERCRKPALIEECNTTIDKNPMCIAEKETVNNTEKRSCAYPSRDKDAIYRCNSSDPGTCTVCSGNLCNVPKGHLKGATKCYYCQEKCKNPLETTECFFIESGCLMITALSYDGNRNKTEVANLRKCVNIIDKANPNQVCEEYKKVFNSSEQINCTVCKSSMCNRLPSDAPDRQPSQKPTSDANCLESYEVLLRSLIVFLILLSNELY